MILERGLEMSNIWSKNKISDVGEVLSGGTPSTTVDEFWGGDIVWITPADLSKIHFPEINDSNKKITSIGLKSSSANIIPKGSIVMSSRAPIGYFAVPTVDFSTNQGCKSIVFNKDHNSLFHYYNFIFNVDKFKAKGEGTTFAEISKKEVEKLEFNLPKLPYQNKIALILSTCDKVIKKTEAAIAKYQAIKTGMMHDLFTRGIDLSSTSSDTYGKLRPKYEDAPELYKESKLGMVPKDWEVDELGNFGEFKNGLNKDKLSFGHGIPFINIIDAYSEKLNISKLGLVDATTIEQEIYTVKEGDIIFVRSSVKPEGVGYNTIFNSRKDGIVYCGFMIRYRILDKFENNPYFFNYYFRNESFRRSLIRVATVSANTNINQENLKKLNSILPTKNEQNKIIERLDNIQNKIDIEELGLNKYKKLKSGLMQDLLMGKVEVKVDEKELEEA
jgi:type I restriction enzyme S subunit